jgi:hypothetical protein
MTVVYAGLARRQLVEAGFRFDNLVMEEVRFLAPLFNKCGSLARSRTAWFFEFPCPFNKFFCLQAGQVKEIESFIPLLLQEDRTRLKVTSDDVPAPLCCCKADSHENSVLCSSVTTTSCLQWSRTSPSSDSATSISRCLRGLCDWACRMWCLIVKAVVAQSWHSSSTGDTPLLATCLECAYTSHICWCVVCCCS